MYRSVYIFAFFSIAISIALGALAAHGLKTKINFEQLESFKTGVFYQLIHGIALIALGHLIKQIYNRLIRTAIILLIAGPLIFSISIYLLSTSEYLGISPIKNVLGPLTPIGGVLMIAGWLCLSFAMIKAKK